MVSYDNYGRKIGEINVIIRPDCCVVTTNTLYNNDRVVTQTISTRDGAGNVQQQTFYNGKILP